MEEWVKTLFKRGTPQCGLAYGIIAFVFAILLVTLGFWKTLLVAVICGLVAFLGGVKNHEQALKNGINHILPKQHTIKSTEKSDETDNSDNTFAE